MDWGDMARSRTSAKKSARSLGAELRKQRRSRCWSRAAYSVSLDRKRKHWRTTSRSYDPCPIKGEGKISMAEAASRGLEPLCAWLLPFWAYRGDVIDRIQ